MKAQELYLILQSVAADTEIVINAGATVGKAKFDESSNVLTIYTHRALGMGPNGETGRRA